MCHLPAGPADQKWQRFAALPWTLLQPTWFRSISSQSTAGRCGTGGRAWYDGRACHVNRGPGEKSLVRNNHPVPPRAVQSRISANGRHGQPDRGELVVVSGFWMAWLAFSSHEANRSVLHGFNAWSPYRTYQALANVLLCDRFLVYRTLHRNHVRTTKVPQRLSA